jgi:hypothetical protein
MTKRPTKRFTTRREIEQEANAFMNKRQLKRQMKELRAKQEKNIQELSQLQVRQDGVDDKRGKENTGRKQKLSKAQEVDEEALLKKLGNDRASQRKSHAAEREKLVKQLQADGAKLVKALKADEARDQKEYKKKQKDKKAGQSDEEAARQLQWDDLMFVHHQQSERQAREQAMALATRTQPYKQRIDHTREKHELATQCRQQHNQWRLAALQARHEDAVKNREATHEIERKNLLEKQELQKAQLVSMQKLEIAQQKKQQVYEEKKRLHDFRLKQKLNSKTSGGKGKSSRSAQAEQEDFMHQERETQAQALRALLDRHERIRDEQRLTHEKFQRILVEDQQMLLQNLLKTQKAQLSKLKEDLDDAACKELLEQADELQTMYTAYYTNITQVMEEHEAAQKELLLVQIKQQMGLLMEQQRTQAAAPERFTEQQAALKEKQRAQYAALVKEQSSQMKAVKRERDAKLADVDKYQSELRAKVAHKAAATSRQHRRRRRTATTTPTSPTSPSRSCRRTAATTTRPTSTTCRRRCRASTRTTTTSRTSGPRTWPSSTRRCRGHCASPCSTRRRLTSTTLSPATPRRRRRRRRRKRRRTPTARRIATPHRQRHRGRSEALVKFEFVYWMSTMAASSTVTRHCRSLSIDTVRANEC